MEDRDAPEAGELLLRLLRRLEELIAIGHVLAAPAREVDVMCRLVPRAAHLGVEMRAGRHHDQRVRREQIGDGAARRAVVILADLAVHRQDHRAGGITCAALRGEIEVAQR